MRQLQRQIAEVKRHEESEMRQRSEMIAHLKDQLQEVKAKTAMETKYVKKVSDVSVAQTQKRCMMTEKALQDEIAVRRGTQTQGRSQGGHGVLPPPQWLHDSPHY